MSIPTTAAAERRLEEYLDSIGVTNPELEGWKVEEAYRAGERVAFVITQGCEIHVLLLTPGRAMSRRNTLQFIAPLLAEHGYVTTRVPRAETDHRLREVLGFSQSWADEHFTYWILTELPFRRQ